MTIFGFKFSLDISLETLNINNKEWKRKPANNLLPKFTSSRIPFLHSNIYMYVKQKIFNNAYCNFAVHYIFKQAELLIYWIYSYWFFDTLLNTGNIYRPINCIRNGSCIFCFTFKNINTCFNRLMTIWELNRRNHYFHSTIEGEYRWGMLCIL